MGSFHQVCPCSLDNYFQVSPYQTSSLNIPTRTTPIHTKNRGTFLTLLTNLSLSPYPLLVFRLCWSSWVKEWCVSYFADFSLFRSLLLQAIRIDDRSTLRFADKIVYRHPNQKVCETNSVRPCVYLNTCLQYP